MGRDKTDTWFFFGDSVTLGVNDTECLGGFVSRLAMLGARNGFYELPPATFYNLGARRQKITQICARFEAEYTARLMPGICSRLAFCTGTVDTLSGTAHADISHELSKLLGRAKEIAPVLFICPPPAADDTVNQKLKHFGLLAQDICCSINVPCVNIFDELLEKGLPSLITDAVHPGREGNELIARTLFDKPAVRTFLTVSD